MKTQSFDSELGELVGYYFSIVTPGNQQFPTEEALNFGRAIKAAIESHLPEPKELGTERRYQDGTTHGHNDCLTDIKQRLEL